MRRVWLLLLAVAVVAPPLLAQGPITPSAAVTSAVYDGNTPVLPRFADVDISASGDNPVVSTASGKKVRVLAGWLTMTGTAVTIQFKSGVGGALEEPLSGAMTPSQGQTIVLPFNPVGWFETSTNVGLNIELGGAQSVDGGLVYVLVD